MRISPQLDVSEFASAKRAKIWELSSTLHCSIVGTCLTASELRRFFVRFGDDGARTASDHDFAAVHVIEMALNHWSGTKSGIVATYNKAKYDRERRLLMDRWAEHVLNLASVYS